MKLFLRNENSIKTLHFFQIIFYLIKKLLHICINYYSVYILVYLF